MRRLGQLSILIFCVANTYAQNVEHDFALQMQKTISYVKEHSSDVWPGFHLSATPIVVYFTDRDKSYSHLYAFNFKPVNPAWLPLNFNQSPVYYLDKDIYNISSIAWGFKTIDGQRSFIFDPDPKQDSLQNVANTVYFRFFNYQHFHNESNFPQNDPWEYPDYNGLQQLMQVKLSYLELEALKNYLQIEDTTQKENSLKDAVAINQYRAMILDAGSKQYDSYLSRNWGLSGYVSWKSLNPLHDTQYIQALNTNCNISSSSNFESIRSCLEYDRYNFLTLVYGLSLDRHLNSEWKKEVETNKASPEVLLQRYYRFSNEEAEARVNYIIKNDKYNFSKLSLIVESKLNPFIEDTNKLQESYRQHPGIELQVFYQPAYENLKSDVRVKNSTETKSYYINNKTELYTNYSGNGGNYDERKLSINFHNIPYFYNNVLNTPFGMQWGKFKVTPDTKLIIDRRVYTIGDFMKDKKRTCFIKLLIENQEVKLTMKSMHGYIDGTGETLIIKYQVL